jgi:hypothetical protein
MVFENDGRRTIDDVSVEGRGSRVGDPLNLKVSHYLTSSGSSTHTGRNEPRTKSLSLRSLQNSPTGSLVGRDCDRSIVRLHRTAERSSPCCAVCDERVGRARAGGPYEDRVEGCEGVDVGREEGSEGGGRGEGGRGAQVLREAASERLG